MIITIDTKKDSEEEIQRVITFLSSLMNKIDIPMPAQMNDAQANNAFATLFDAAESQTIETLNANAAEKPASTEKPKIRTYNW